MILPVSLRLISVAVRDDSLAGFPSAAEAENRLGS